MNIKKNLWKTMIILSITLPVWAQDRIPELSLGDQAPDIDVTIIKGESVDIHGEKSEEVFLVEFWATWCPACRASMPHLSYLQKKHKDDGLVIVGISIEEDPDIVRAFVDQDPSRMNYTVAVDRNLATAYKYMLPFGEENIPHAFLVDKTGMLVWHGHPADPSLEELLAERLKGTSDSVSEREQPSAR